MMMRELGLALKLISVMSLATIIEAIGANWGMQASHPLPPDVVVRLLRANGFQKVKLFDAEYSTLKALGSTNIEVMVGIPNDMLYLLATSSKAADKWVANNVTTHINNNNVNIRYVAVGNEPFLTTYNGTFLKTTFPALSNIQKALIKAGLGDKVKVTIPLNADVYSSASDLPSGGDFRADIYDTMLQIVGFLSSYGSPFTVNIYPFISLYINSDFPVDYAFFDGNAKPVVDGGNSYYNMFDANFDTLVYALQKNGYPNMPIIVGEAGWPTDGDRNANPTNAQRFYQGFMSRIAEGKGTPLRPQPMDAYLFSLIDEDQKSIEPGSFERHWGIFTFDGLPKYNLNLGATNSGGLVGATGVEYLEKKWCVMKPSSSLSDPSIAPSVSYACALSDCTSLGYQSSCGSLDSRGNISYAFNNYYQNQNQADKACGFNVSTITKTDPSTPSCRFAIEIQPYYATAVRIAGQIPLLPFVFPSLLFFHCAYYS